MGLQGTVGEGTSREHFASAAVPVAQNVCESCGRHFEGRPDRHQCDPISSEAMAAGAEAATSETGFARLGKGFPGGKKAVEDELDAIAIAVRMFHVKAPDQVLRECAAYSARLTELIVMLGRLQGNDPTYLKLRTTQVEKWHAELERQSKTASRLIEVQRQDLALGGYST